jgi:nicotinamidase-related amidase
MKIYSGMTRENTALLVIDPVNFCSHKNCETPEWNIYFSKIRNMLPKLNEFVKEYRKKIGGLVILTTITPWRKEYLPDNLNLLYTDPEAKYYSEDTTGFDGEFHTVEAAKDDYVISKNTYDAFTSVELVKILSENKIKYIVMTGVFSDGCVLASVISGFAKGFNFVVLKDLIETTDDKIRQKIQRYLIDFTFPKMYGRTLNSEEFLSEFILNL